MQDQISVMAFFCRESSSREGMMYTESWLNMALMYGRLWLPDEKIIGGSSLLIPMLS